MEFTKEKLKEQIDFYKKFDDERNLQKLRGKNEFNLFSVLLKINDEVRLHSRFICELLDPRGSHYQGTLFLEEFLKICGIGTFFNVSNVTIHKELHNIDLLLTDGKRYLIIENKLDAPEQPEQITRYIEKVRKIYSPACEDIKVLYLSKDKNQLEEFANNEISIECEELEIEKENKNENEKYFFKFIHYNKEIISWLKISKSHIENITNLSLYFQNYIEIIEKYYNNYTPKIMNLKQFFDGEQDKDFKKEFILYAKNIRLEYDELMQELEGAFIKKIIDYFEKQDLNGWKINKDGCYLYKDNNDLCYVFYNTEDGLGYGIANKTLETNVIQNENIKVNDYWLRFETFKKGFGLDTKIENFADLITDSEPEETFFKKSYEYFGECLETLNK